jgi:CDP-diacylglycerol--glycerol-3-phosphate 3-phosphatidyltransferase
VQATLEHEASLGGSVFDGNLRRQVDRRTAPIGKALVGLGLTADLITGAGLVLSLAAGVVAASGHLLLAAAFVGLGALSDLLDGPVAKAAHAQSSRGAFFDSVADRVSDAALVGGVAVYLLDRNQHLLAILALVALSLGFLISYERAKAESLGLSAKGGLMERAERTVVLLVGLVIPVLLPTVLVALVLASGLTVVQRFVKVWRQASRRPDRVQAKSALTNLRRLSRRRRVRSRASLQRLIGGAGGLRERGRQRRS